MQPAAFNFERETFLLIIYLLTEEVLVNACPYVEQDNVILDNFDFDCLKHLFLLRQKRDNV